MLIKCLERRTKGKQPLSTKCEETLIDVLYPLVDFRNELHRELCHIDNVLVLKETQILNRFKQMV